MTQIDGTKYLRQMKSKPDFSILLLGLLWLSVISIVWLSPMECHGPYFELPEFKHFKYEFESKSMPKIYISQYETIYLQDTPVENIAGLSFLIKDLFEELKIEGEKIALIVDEDVEFGYLSAVLEQIKKADIPKVFLVTQDKVTGVEVLHETGQDFFVEYKPGGTQ